MNEQERKLEQLLRMAAQLAETLEADIAALQSGKPREMRMVSPEMQRLSSLFAREIKSLDPAAAHTAPEGQKRQFREAVAQVRELLNQHMRHLNRMRNASEGMIKAVAEDVVKKRASLRPYASPRASLRPQPIDPMLLNATA